MGSGSRPAGSDAELQPDARLLPLPAGQALRPVLRHRRQGAAVWTPRGHLQAVAHVASKGEASGRPTEGTLACFTLVKVRSEHSQSTGIHLWHYFSYGHFITFYSVEGHTRGHFISLLILEICPLWVTWCKRPWILFCLLLRGHFIGVYPIKRAVSLCSHRLSDADQVVVCVFCQGTIGFEAQIDKCLELSEYLYNKIKDREGYEMVFNGKVSANSRRQHWAAPLPLTSAAL